MDFFLGNIGLVIENTFFSAQVCSGEFVYIKKKYFPVNYTHARGLSFMVVRLAFLLSFFLNPVDIQARESSVPLALSEPSVILFFGDSITSGYGLEKKQAFPALIEQKIDLQGRAFKVVNAGLSGETTAAGLRRIDWLLKRKIDFLVLELGANDGLRGVPLSTTRKNLQAIIDRAKKKYPQMQIVIAGMQIPPNLGPEYTAEFSAIFPALAKKNNAALIPFLLEGVGGVPELNLPDGIHPTSQGHKIVAENVWKVLGPLLEEPMSREPQEP